jgi:hypothetical protein
MNNEGREVAVYGIGLRRDALARKGCGEAYL